MRILLLQAEIFNALVFTGVMLLFLLRAPVAYLRINPQVEEVPEYLKTIPPTLLYCTYNALSKYILSYINKTFIHYSFFLYGIRPAVSQCQLAILT